MPCATDKTLFMKKLTYVLSIFSFLVLAYSCTKNEQVSVVPLIKFSNPKWSRDTTGKYAYSMTAVVRVPDSLKPVSGINDQIGAFINFECRGTGVLVKSGKFSMYYILIQGTAAESSNIVFKYYNAASQNIFMTAPSLAFTVDGSYGSPDKPVMLSMQGIK